MDEQRPIGWWVKRLDTLLEEVVDRVVAPEGLTRRHWQALHALAGGQEDRAALRTALADFSAADAVDAVVSDLAGRGWVEPGDGDRVRLTADGRSAHDRIAVTVTRVRRHLADGLSASEYERTILVLRRMVENVSRALDRTER
ncbi:MarR family transcriptional regulator [Geodermatophilus sp. TF02-6]|uniref:MarR family winged helix-turn-helix transcriptional regulator n=1 Tax=Geodermatophilus sp. TF02-6 TaxID=2250575 RepID=UPI000DE8612A|nr:winged helix DNA-binding protein [Geodermatophilus sp. TF02-6]RBY75783.1 MarR family transcriptional regulator [Geodermatophilus sp. TF02-6]